MARPRKLSAKQLDQTRDLYSAGKPASELPARPSIFQADPFVSGPPELAKLVEQLTRLAPHMKEGLRGVQSGPTPGVMEQMLRRDEPIERYTKASLLGARDPQRGDVSINPRVLPGGDMDSDFLETVIHELAHAAGQDERGAGLAENIVRGNFKDALKRVRKRAPDAKLPFDR
jgi:hypothetical protein